MLLSTTPTIEGYEILEYLGLVFGEYINGVDYFKDFGAGITNFLGGRSRNYEQEIITARTNAIREMSEHAREIGANAVVGIKVDYEPISTGERGASMLMVTVSGTAIVLR